MGQTTTDQPPKRPSIQHTASPGWPGPTLDAETGLGRSGRSEDASNPASATVKQEQYPTHRRPGMARADPRRRGGPWPVGTIPKHHQPHVRNRQTAPVSDTPRARKNHPKSNRRILLQRRLPDKSAEEASNGKTCKSRSQRVARALRTRRGRSLVTGRSKCRLHAEWAPPSRAKAQTDNRIQTDAITPTSRPHTEEKAHRPVGAADSRGLRPFRRPPSLDDE